MTPAVVVSPMPVVVVTPMTVVAPVMTPAPVMVVVPAPAAVVMMAVSPAVAVLRLHQAGLGRGRGAGCEGRRLGCAAREETARHQGGRREEPLAGRHGIARRQHVRLRFVSPHRCGHGGQTGADGLNGL